ncbi:ABC transporter permease [Palleronia sp.]|uniref:ABC transporter permease n=1 Tax=Palleronia sp. TaxID=1940284 RepID=UPI0035C83129
MSDATAKRPEPVMSRAWREADPICKAALVCALVLAVLALFAPWIAPHEPTAQSLLSRLRPPVGFERADPRFLLGTDELGRDILARSLYGLRLTLMLALLGATLGLLIGATLGVVAGVAGRRVDAAIMAAVDAQIAIPFTLVAIFCLALLGSSLPVMIVVLGLAYWEQYARIIRGDVRRLMRMPFVEAARAAGAGPRRIAVVHLLPNIVSPLVVQFTLSLSNIILLESTLSFLGLGVQPPTATLGAMVGVGRTYMPTAPWIVLAPALLILLITFSVQIIGDWLRDQADVRLRSR